MSIFSQENFNDVQEVIKKTNGQTGKVLRKEPLKDEIADLNGQSERIQELIEAIDSLPDLKSRKMMQECIQEILNFYGNGLERILKIISNGNNAAAKDIYNDLVDDSFVNGLLLIHDLHPLDLKTRLYKALDKVKPYMDSHGGNVELISLENGVAKLKLSGSCNGCPSSSSTLELGIKQAIEENCPDLLGLEVEGISVLQHQDKSLSQSGPGWKIVGGLSKLPNGNMLAVESSGTQLIVCRVDDQLYAYRNYCPGCERSFSNGMLEDKILGCQLGHKYDVKLAGACTNDPELHLDPFPLLEEGGVVKIAVN